MKRRELVVAVAAACALGWVARSAWSDDPPADPNEAWMKLGKPGEQHARLKALAGEWAVHGVLNEGGKTTETDSTATMTMIMGGRFLRQDVKGTFQGAPFEGFSVMGYDNGKKRYVSVWADNMGTGLLIGEGEESQAGKVLTFKSTMSGPQGPVSERDVLTIAGENDLGWESYFGDGDKPMMTLRYKRKGATDTAR